MPYSVAVIGAGISGLACARSLRAAGWEVTVFEKSASLGGRIATRRSELGGFDHGAQYFTVRGGRFAVQMNEWQADGLIAEWTAQVVALRDGVVQPGSGNTQRFVGVPGMSSLGNQMAIGLDVRLEQPIKRLERIGSGSTARWALKRLADPAEPASIEITEGLFDAVAVAIPSDQALELVSGVPELASAASKVRLEPSWAAMLAFSEPLNLHYDAAFVDGHRLAWIARDSSKPGRRPGERWIAHAARPWTIEHLDDDMEDVRIKLTRSFQETTGIATQPIYTSVHRWRYALVSQALGETCLWENRWRVGMCGDWCAGPRIENAWLSGATLADKIMATFS